MTEQEFNDNVKRFKAVVRAELSKLPGKYYIKASRYNLPYFAVLLTIYCNKQSYFQVFLFEHTFSELDKHNGLKHEENLLTIIKNNARAFTENNVKNGSPND